MSDNGSNSEWIYLLLTLIAGGLSLLKAKKTKKKEGTDTQDRFPDIFQDVEEYEVAQTTNIDIIKDRWAERSEVTASREISDSLQKEKNLQEEQEELFAQEEEEGYDFDLKKAIISSEILQRKYD